MVNAQFPLFPLTCVGSFPKPDYLLRARRAYAKKEIAAEELAAAEQEATHFWLGFQERVGLDLLVDGEQYRGDMVAYFAEHLSGFTAGGLVESYGNRFYKKPVIIDTVRWTQPITVNHFRFAQQAATKPVKAIVTGPYTMYHWSFDDFYPSKEEALQDLVQAVRQEVLALAQGGAQFIQIDEPAMSAVPEDFPFVKQGLEAVTQGLSSVHFFTHICYGKFDRIYPQLLELPIANYDLEIANRQFHLYNLFKEQPFTKELSLGVVDVHTHRLETPGQVMAFIEKALTIIPPEQLWISPDCGLKTRTVEEAQQKVAVMARAVHQFRERFW